MKTIIVERRRKAALFVQSKDFDSLCNIVANGCPINKKIIKDTCHTSVLEKLLRCAKQFDDPARLYNFLCSLYAVDDLNQKLAKWNCQPLLRQAGTEKLIALQQLEALAQKDEQMAAEFLGDLGRFDLLVKYPNDSAIIVLRKHERVYDLQRLGRL